MSPAEAEVALRAGRRQSLWAPVFMMLTAARRVGIAQFAILGALLVANRSSVVLLTIAPLVAVLAIAASVLAWWRFTYTLSDDSLTVDSGVLNRQRIVVPLAKIQSVAIDQKLLHRPIGLVEARVDTAGSSSAELTIHATDRVTAEVIREVASRARAIDSAASPQAVAGADAIDGEVAPVAPPDPPVVILRRNVGELITVALTTQLAAGLVVLAPLFAVAGQLDEWFDVPLPQVQIDGAGDLIRTAIVFGAIAVVVVGAVRVLSVVIADYDVTLTRDGRALRRESGLFDRRSTASSIVRVQQLEVSTNPLQQRVGMAAVRLPTAGDSDEIRVDGTRLDELAVLRDLVIDADVQIDTTSRGIDRAAAFAWWRWPVMLSTIATAVGAFWTPWALLGLAASPVSIWSARRRQRRWLWDNTSIGLKVEHGLVATSSTELALRRTQSAAVTQTFFERRRGLASCTVRTAESGVTVPFIALAEAQRLRDTALAATASDRRPWF